MAKRGWAVLIASLGFCDLAVNIYLMSYIRHVNFHLLLDGKGGFVVKSTL